MRTGSPEGTGPTRRSGPPQSDPPDGEGRALARTELAWQRTALTMIGGAAVVFRLTMDRLGAWSVLALLVNLALGLVVLVLNRHPLRGRADGVRDGRSATALTAAVVILGGIMAAEVMMR